MYKILAEFSLEIKRHLKDFSKVLLEKKDFEWTKDSNTILSQDRKLVF